MSEAETRTVLITGANAGIGRSAAGILAAGGARVLLLCRDSGRGEEAREAIAERAAGPEPELFVADLARPAEVRRAAEQVLERHAGLNAVVANAGIYRARRSKTEAGIERTLAVNHLGHFLLVGLLWGGLADDGRVVVVSSESHRAGRLERRPLEEIFRAEGDYSGWQAYADSKLANLLFAFELGRRAGRPGIGVLALHPGMLATRIWNRNHDLGSLAARLIKPWMGSPDEGGRRVARLVMDPELAGARDIYFKGDKPSRASEMAYERDLATRLWELSEMLLDAG